MENIKDFLFGSISSVLFCLAVTSVIMFTAYQLREIKAIKENITSSSNIITLEDVGENAQFFTKDEVVAYLMSNPNIIVYVDGIPFGEHNFDPCKVNMAVVDKDKYKREIIIDKDNFISAVKFISE